MEWILAAVGLLIATTVVLPSIIKAKLNAALKKMDGYTGRIEKLQVNLLAGRIKVNNVTITKVGVVSIDPVLQIPEVIIYFRLGRLLKRNFHLKVLVNAPKISIVDDSMASTTIDSEQKHSDQSSKLKDSLTAMKPFRIDAEVRDATVRYQKNSSHLDLTVTRVNVMVADFTNHPAQTDPCLIRMNGFMNEGTMNVVINLQPLAPTLTLDSVIELKSINLVPFNDLIKAYGKVDINTGTLDCFAEIVVANNYFSGYLKPILTNLDFIGIEDKNDSLIRKVWERIVATGVQLLINGRNGQLATTIPIKGRLDDPEVNVLAAFAGLLRNAFIKALRPSLEDMAGIALGQTKKQA